MNNDELNQYIDGLQTIVEITLPNSVGKVELRGTVDEVTTEMAKLSAIYGVLSHRVVTVEVK